MKERKEQKMNESDRIILAKKLTADFREILHRVREGAIILNEANRLCGIEAELKFHRLKVK